MLGIIEMLLGPIFFFFNLIFGHTLQLSSLSWD